MPWPVHPTGFFGIGGGFDTYRIERSLRFNSGDSTRLYWNDTVGGTTTYFTYSFWIKRSLLTSTQVFISGGTSSSNFGQIGFDSSDKFFFYENVGGVIQSNISTSAVFRDPSSWYHIVLIYDSREATSTNRIKVYVNGVLQTISGTFPGLNLGSFLAYISHKYIGTQGYGASPTGSYFSGYLAEINYINAQTLAPTSFGETDPITGRWKAKAYAGAYGASDFYLNFADNSGTTATTLGKDSSGKGNNWTPTNFSITAGATNDSLVDSPTNYGSDTGVGGEVRGNYATLNPISTIRGTIIDGNLRTNGGDRGSIATIGMSSGKWFCEMYVTTVGAESTLGVSQGLNILNTYVGSTSDSWGYRSNGPKYNNAISATYGSSYTSGDKIGCAFDADNGILEFYKNGVSQGTAYTGLTSGPYYFATSGRSATSANDVTINFGQQAWAHTPPSGFKALCTQNLPQPTIQKPSKYMDALAYTGAGASNSISSLGFSPDLVWIKNRGTTTSHAIYDTIRGAQSQLSSDTTGDQVTSSSGLTSFDANGFTIGTSTLINTSGTQYVAWSWDESVQAGLDIVSYTGNGTNRTISHNLGVAPKMIIVKARTTAGADQGWPVWHTSIANTTYLGLNSTSATATGADYWNSTSPTSSVFSLGANAAVNANNDTYISYLFSEIEGYSKFGSYTGNGSADGPFVWCGFRPRWVLIKTTNQVDINWIQHDAARNESNLSASRLRPNSNGAEASDNGIDILSNGFKMRSADGATNASGSTFIFAAFAESPFKYARAR
jgi:hypothetical protein